VRALHPNLAARPYRDYRPVWAVAGAIILLTAALLAYNVQTAWRYFATTQETRGEIEKLEQEIAKERERTGALRQAVARFDTADLQSRSIFVNDRIAERAFSWSALLDDLESVLPNDVRLTRLSPSALRDGGYSISMECVAKSEDGMVNLIRRFFANPRFARPTPTSERVDEGQYAFTISVDYNPAAPGVRP
jgi:type IV pilus assembly protein PilN